mmetsp:Transcript_73701/g.206925  ORF Transcript_73701/g.206925 Transcript_73701/m.206925 type:complete len:364 (+) Transcript_73701:157-1248(+)
MLSHLKAREMNQTDEETCSAPTSAAQQPPAAAAASIGEHPDEHEEATRATCDVLCSLGSTSYAPEDSHSAAYQDDSTECSYGDKPRKGKACPKQHQLPMFLSKTYHMIDRCDSTIATWSAAGDNFVVKNVEKFASDVLPLYFKHSNFSSFARQLNFYGFRKLRTDPILTSDVDPDTACYVRFYHEKFQKDRPELLHQIKRATKSDLQSKDDVDSLKHEVCRLKDCIGRMSSEMDRKLAEMSYEYNRRITTLSAEYDKLAALVTQAFTRGQVAEGFHAPADASNHSRVPPDLMHSLSQVAAISLQNQLRLPPTLTPPGSSLSPGLVGSGGGVATAEGVEADGLGTKRPSPEGDSQGSTNRQRTG